METVKNLFYCIIGIASYLLFGVISLVIGGATIWLSLFMLGWFLGMIGVL